MQLRGGRSSDRLSGPVFGALYHGSRSAVLRLPSQHGLVCRTVGIPVRLRGWAVEPSLGARSHGDEPRRDSRGLLHGQHQHELGRKSSRGSKNVVRARWRQNRAIAAKQALGSARQRQVRRRRERRGARRRSPLRLSSGSLLREPPPCFLLPGPGSNRLQPLRHSLQDVPGLQP